MLHLLLFVQKIVLCNIFYVFWFFSLYKTAFFALIYTVICNTFSTFLPYIHYLQ